MHCLDEFNNVGAGRSQVNASARAVIGPVLCATDAVRSSMAFVASLSSGCCRLPPTGDPMWGARSPTCSDITSSSQSTRLITAASQCLLLTITTIAIHGLPVFLWITL